MCSQAWAAHITATSSLLLSLWTTTSWMRLLVCYLSRSVIQSLSTSLISCCMKLHLSFADSSFVVSLPISVALRHWPILQAVITSRLMSSFLSLKNVILACLSKFWICTVCMQMQRALSHDQTASSLHFPSGVFVASNSCCMSKALHGAFPTSFICPGNFSSHLWSALAISPLRWTCLLNLPTEMTTPHFFCILA